MNEWQFEIVIQLNLFLKSIISPKSLDNSPMCISLQCFFFVCYDLFYFIGFKVVSNLLLICFPILQTIFTNVLWMLEKKIYSLLVGDIHTYIHIFSVCFRSTQTTFRSQVSYTNVLKGQMSFIRVWCRWGRRESTYQDINSNIKKNNNCTDTLPQPQLCL